MFVSSVTRLKSVKTIFVPVTVNVSLFFFLFLFSIAAINETIALNMDVGDEFYSRLSDCSREQWKETKAPRVRSFTEAETATLRYISRMYKQSFSLAMLLANAAAITSQALLYRLMF